MHVKRIAECFQRSILKYCRPSLSYHLSLRSLSIFSNRFTQVHSYTLTIFIVRALLRTSVWHDLLVQHKNGNRIFHGRVFRGTQPLHDNKL